MKAFATLFIGACLLASTEQGWAQCAGPAPFLLPPVSPLASAPVSHEDDTAKLEVGQQIVAMLWPQERLEALHREDLEKILNMWRGRIAKVKNPSHDPGLQKILDDSTVSIPQRFGPLIDKALADYIESVARTYGKKYSLAELKDIAAISCTPAGQPYLSHVENDQDVSTYQMIGNLDLQSAYSKMETDLILKILSYLKQHPALAAKLKTAAQKAKP